jgi:ppGpp synthetase/RelA/SpoT-type nucleotidyltranferase
MKILQSISKIYNDQAPVIKKLKDHVDNIMMAKKRSSWHYLSRIKNLESFALKLETGRVDEPDKMEDFFGCTLVVENIAEIKNAISVIHSEFFEKYRRPNNDNITHKRPSSFEFDDLRLYVTIKKADYLPDSPLNDILFEIQVKTFLQHAWGIATHDLIYKADKVSWGTARVAFQVKAMLEQAEITISGAEELSKLPELNKTNKEMSELVNTRKFLIDNFKEENLPEDIVRLSQIIGDMQRIFRLTLEGIKNILDAEDMAGRGRKTLDLSPYAIILQSIINQKQQEFSKPFKEAKNLKQKILIPQEIIFDKKLIAVDDNIVRT